MHTAMIFALLLSAFLAVKSSTILPSRMSGCMYQGTWYPEGSFRPDPCRPCQCREGRAVCAIVDCIMPPCVDAVRNPDQCCPVCPNGPNCRAPNGQVISADHEVQIDRETTCTCAGNGFMSIGQATCVKTAQPVS